MKQRLVTVLGAIPEYLASLFHPSAPNDVAPGAYNDPEPRDGLPPSPLEPATQAGFRWG